MAKKLPRKDVVLVGFGWTAAILGQELTEEGLEVLAIERGAWRDTSTDFAVSFAQDELRYYWRRELFQEPARETLTFRNTRDQTALPMGRPNGRQNRQDATNDWECFHRSSPVGLNKTQTAVR